MTDNRFTYYINPDDNNNSTGLTYPTKPESLRANDDGDVDEMVVQALAIASAVEDARRVDTRYCKNAAAVNREDALDWPVVAAKMLVSLDAAAGQAAQALYDIKDAVPKSRRKQVETALERLQRLDFDIIPF